MSNSMSNGASLDVIGRHDPKLIGHLSSSSLVNSQIVTNAAWKTIQVNQDPGEHFIINEKDLDIYPVGHQLNTIDQS